MSSSNIFTQLSSSHFQSPTYEPRSDGIIDSAWRTFVAQYVFLGALLFEINLLELNLECIAAWNLPIEPFNGSERNFVLDALTDCFKHPKAHVHGLGNYALPNIAKRLGRWTEGTTRVAFVPFAHDNVNLVFIGFRKHDAKELVFGTDFFASLMQLVTTIYAFRKAGKLEATLSATEAYVREVGHEFASNVQAILAKLSLLQKGRIPAANVLSKLNEIEAEVRAAYGLADQLGVTVDPEYQIRNHTDFDVLDLVEQTKQQLSADAGERKITFTVKAVSTALQLWGDGNAMKHALVQMTINAIKYAYGSSNIVISVERDDNFVKVIVENRGHKLPDGLERKRIWDLGVRGKEARELHVNGSGVGLFTVKKIVTAHHGRVGCEQYGDITKFWMSIPKKEYLRKELGVLL